VTGGNSSGDRETFIMQADGVGVRQRTNNTMDDMVSAWSPKGRKIAFVSNRDGNLDDDTIDADGGQQTNRTNDGGGDFYPNWQPKRRKGSLRGRDGSRPGRPQPRRARRAGEPASLLL
jgi:Tol biopolymer transport system component